MRGDHTTATITSTATSTAAWMMVLYFGSMDVVDWTRVYVLLSAG